MRIEKIHITGFGCLSERTYEFPADKAVLVLESNESGKSTLAAAIVAGLCGFPKRKTSGESLKLKDVFRPWSGEKYALEMEIEADGAHYIIERDFARDRFAVREKATNRDITAQCNSDLTMHFLKLPREDFGRVAIISGKEAQQFSSSPNLQSRLSALIDGAQDETGGDVAISALENAKYTLGTAIKPDNAVKRLIEALETKRSALAALDAKMEAASEDAKALEEAKTTHLRLSNEAAKLDNEYKSARLREVRVQLTSLEANASAVDELKKELATLEIYSSFPIERREQLTKAIARMEEKKLQAKSLQDKQELARRESADIRSRLDESAGFSAASKDDLALLKSCEDALKMAEVNFEKNSRDIQVLKRNLASEGLDLEYSKEQWKRFERLSSADREFLSSFRERELELQAEQNRAEAEEKDCSEQLRIIQSSEKQKKLGWVLLVAGGLLGLACVILLILRILPIPASFAGVVAASMVAAAGIAKIVRARGGNDQDTAKLQADLEQAHTHAIFSKGKLGELHQKLAAIAADFGVEPDKIVAAYKESEKANARCESLNPLMAQLSQMREMKEAAETRAQSLLRRLGVSCETGCDLADLLQRTQENLARYLRDKERSAGIDSEIGAIEREIEKTLAGVSEEKKIAEDILSDARIDAKMPLDEALRKFEEAEKRFSRFREIKNALLPSAAKHAASDDTVSKLRTEESALLEALDGADIETERTSSEVESDRQEVRIELDRAAAVVSDLDRTVGSCVESYRSEYPQLNEEAEKLEAELKKATQFKSAIDIAARVMREVCEDSRKKWASALNKRASLMLPHLNNSYDTLLFDDSLGFSLRHIAENKVIQKDEVDAFLSTGAKDQVYLTVRLACCGELSKLSEPVPIILDDPLMAADDERFRAGFQYFACELPKSQQVILLSCHESRHLQLKNEPWFAENVCVIAL